MNTGFTTEGAEKTEGIVKDEDKNDLSDGAGGFSPRSSSSSVPSTPSVVNPSFQQLEAAGIEPPALLAGETALSERGGAESGALRKATFVSDLAMLIAAWPDLPQPIKAGILALVHASK